MQIHNLFKPFEIDYFLDVDACPCKRHKHTFFEITYILKGEGIYNISGNRFNYKANDLFLVMPDADHYTQVHSNSGFLFIRFNNIYLQAQKASGRQHSDLGEWIQKLEYILQNGQQLPGPVNLHTSDQPLTRALCDAILQGADSAQPLQKELMQQLINTLIMVVARNVARLSTELADSQSQTGRDILQYIQQHIYEPEKLKAEVIAAHFNISLNYIGEYFKKHTHGGMQQYIINYRISLIEIRLRHSDMRLNEIAGEFGFTDESHFTRTFKKYKGISPSAYRRTIKEQV